MSVPMQEADFFLVPWHTWCDRIVYKMNQTRRAACMQQGGGKQDGSTYIGSIRGLLGCLLHFGYKYHKDCIEGGEARWCTSASLLQMCFSTFSIDEGSNNVEFFPLAPAQGLQHVSTRF